MYLEITGRRGTGRKLQILIGAVNDAIRIIQDSRNSISRNKWESNGVFHGTTLKMFGIMPFIKMLSLKIIKMITCWELFRIVVGI